MTAPRPSRPRRSPAWSGGKPKLVDHLDYDIHIDHAVLGLIDPAHGPFVHRQWWWRTGASQHEKHKAFAPSEAGFTMTRHTPSRNSKAYAILGGEPLTEITFRLPGLRWEHVKVGERQVLALSAMTPINAGKTRMNQIIWSDHPAFTALYPVIRLAARAFLRQDGRIVAAQARGLRDNPALMWMGDADQQGLWYHQLKREWNASRREARAFRNPVEETTLRWRT
ncbi:phenylpropionate dioxygenase-like ring-hydroxylating dioxygenase large terminal subunit [Caulobacter rhizosphaerae]|uniref:Phenylpropionate dioxygenase-like ring-hydroxylating dioxygenase large terminal subunit n=1 Tax=Caulobacter rhizosphaerae TaxID=2010972 RepID=A0ABU1MYA2_9CAUL|nr:phenylpropionate dioxygenase-like ring-hydroxylating dioxygenase large terminal subunit [Caulobacter rhizosphaerae]